MGVMWLAVLGAGTSGHQCCDAPAINKNKETNSERFPSAEDAEHAERWKDSEGRSDRGKHSWRGHTLGGDAKSKVKESRHSEHGGERQGSTAWAGGKYASSGHPPSPQEKLLYLGSRELTVYPLHTPCPV